MLAADALRGRFAGFGGFQVEVGFADEAGEGIEEFASDVDSAVGAGGEYIAESGGSFAGCVLSVGVVGIGFEPGVDEEDDVGVSGESSE